MPANARLPRSSLLLWLPVAVVGWAGFAVIAAQLAGLDPPRLGDDLRVLVDAGARWREGDPLYAAVPSGAALPAESLFFSYPPIVAQAMSLVAGLPFPTIFVGWTAGAVAGLWLAARRLGRGGRSVALPALALAPYTYPLAVALLLGNVNAWFPLAFGLLLAAILVAGQWATAAGGAALAVAAVTKLHPASLGLWLTVRGVRDVRAGSGGRAFGILGVAVVVGVGLLAVSVAIGGLEPWAAYVTFLRESAGDADIISPLNVGPASQVALALGLSEATARSLQVLVAIVAIAGTLAAAWTLGDPVESFAWGTVASLVILPVTWFHYPVALVPVAIAAASRARGAGFVRTAALLAAAIVAAGLAVLAPVLIWVAVALVLAAVRVSRIDAVEATS